MQVHSAPDLSGLLDRLAGTRSRTSEASRRGRRFLRAQATPCGRWRATSPARRAWPSPTSTCSLSWRCWREAPHDEAGGPRAHLPVGHDAARRPPGDRGTRRPIRRRCRCSWRGRLTDRCWRQATDRDRAGPCPRRCEAVRGEARRSGACNAPSVPCRRSRSTAPSARRAQAGALERPPPRRSSPASSTRWRNGWRTGTSLAAPYLNTSVDI